MSIGYVGYCKKESEDDFTVFYSYSGANWNNLEREKADETAYDGTFAVDKSVLLCKPSKPRKQVEYIDWTYSAVENGQAKVIVECKNAFYRGEDKDIDYIALRLFLHIFDYLHEHGLLPDKESFIQ